MDEIVKLVSQRAGIPEDKARTAVETVVAQLRQRLPAPIAGQLDSALTGGGGNLGDMAKGLGGMFGR